jgi:putative transposase
MTPGAPLPNGPVYHHSLMENDKIKGEIQEIIQNGHISPKSSPCGSTIVLVQKKERTWRLCINYRELNKIIVRNQYIIPRINDLLEKLKGKNFFNNIDLNSSYHQVPIEPIDVWKTTFKYK